MAKERIIGVALFVYPLRGQNAELVNSHMVIFQLRSYAFFFAKVFNSVWLREGSNYQVLFIVMQVFLCSVFHTRQNILRYLIWLMLACAVSITDYPATNGVVSCVSCLSILPKHSMCSLMCYFVVM
jgi:hypothetical protein